MQSVITIFRIKATIVIIIGFLSIDLFGLIVLIVIGLIIIFLLRVILILVPAAIVAFVVWYLTNSTWWAGIAFLIVAALSILRRF